MYIYRTYIYRTPIYNRKPVGGGRQRIASVGSQEELVPSAFSVAACRGVICD